MHIPLQPQAPAADAAPRRLAWSPDAHGLRLPARPMGRPEPPALLWRLWPRRWWRLPRRGPVPGLLRPAGC